MKIATHPGEPLRDAIARTFGVRPEDVRLDGDLITIRQWPGPDDVPIDVVTGVLGHGDVLENLRTNKEGEMPATAIPGTPANADEIEAIALKNMDLETAADRQAAHEQAQHLAKDASRKRNAAILALLQHGHQPQEIADALGITRGRVAQIASRGGIRVAEEETS